MANEPKMSFKRKPQSVILHSSDLLAHLVINMLPLSFLNVTPV
jgi:hypothetical protein